MRPHLGELVKEFHDNWIQVYLTWLFFLRSLDGGKRALNNSGKSDALIISFSSISPGWLPRCLVPIDDAGTQKERKNCPGAAQAIGNNEFQSAVVPLSEKAFRLWDSKFPQGAFNLSGGLMLHLKKTLGEADQRTCCPSSPIYYNLHALISCVSPQRSHH